MGLTDIFQQVLYSSSERTSVKLPDNIMPIIGKKYLRGETPEQLFDRVSRVVASPLAPHVTAEDLGKIENVFFNLLASRDFLPNSPTLMNAGRAFNQLAACFVVPVVDSMEGIFRDAMADMAAIQKTGGGTGFDFSALRPQGASVSSTMGESSGPLSFMRAFNACTDTIKQGGARRGANMGILRVDHPDIREFIKLKSDPNEMTNFNLSVAVTDAFMAAAAGTGQEYELRHEGKVYGKENAAEIWDLIAQQAWATGEPGVIFIDTINDFNTIPGAGELAATNPCGEQPLLPYEACNLGSINLGNMVLNGAISERRLRTATRLATIFLDCVIDAGDYPLEKIATQVKQNRKIGLGVMGFADMCVLLRIGYDSPEACDLADKVMAMIQDEAEHTSAFLAEHFGNFPNFDKGDFQTRRRNATLTTIAPTGTISLIAGASYGIEPFFALSYNKTLTDTGEVITYLNQHVLDYMAEKRFTPDLIKSVTEYIDRVGSMWGIANALADSRSRDLKEMEMIFVTAQDIAPADHVHVQAAFQRHVDNAVSKTINFANDVTAEQIKYIFRLAFRSGCKGITVYRDGCRSSQPLTVNKTKEVAPVASATPSEVPIIEVAPAVPKALKRPRQLVGVTRQIPTGCGMMLVTINLDEDNNIFEVLMRAGATGGCSAYTDGVARLLSIGLRYNIPTEVLIDQLRSVSCDNFRFRAGKDPNLKGKSCPDVVGRFMNEILGEIKASKQPVTPIKDIAWGDSIAELRPEQLDDILQQATINTTGTLGEKCPECGMVLLRAEGCITCRCGYSRC